jgi:lipoate-protein ligase B
MEPLDMRVIAPLSGEPLDVVRLPGLTPYHPLWKRQQALAAARRQNEIADLLFLLEHPHVYTNGRRGRREHLLISEAALAALGADSIEVDRGGDITYHGPGQLVGYAIVDLIGARLGVRAYVHGLEQVLIRTAAQFDVRATTAAPYTGVWVGDAKLAAIGVKVSRNVTCHGFAFNVDPDLTYFSHIVPCGIPNRGVTSLARLLGRTFTVDEVVPVCARAFAEEFGFDLHWGGEAPAHRDTDARYGISATPLSPAACARAPNSTSCGRPSDTSRW